MNVERGKTSFSDEEIADLRARLEQYKTWEGVSWDTLGKRVDVPAGTLQPWFKNNYRGDVQSVAYKVNKFFVTEATRQELELVAPMVPGFLPTATARRLHSQFRWAQRGKMTIAVGTAGVGKTAAMQQYAEANTNAWLVTMSSATKTPTTMLQEIMFTVGRHEGRYGLSLQALFHTVCDRLEPFHGLLLVDEAQHLRDDSLDLLRQVHDRIKVGIALCGNEEVSTRIQGSTRRSAFAQLYSRISNIMVLDRPDEGDVELLLNAWGVTHALERSFLQKIAAQPGCLRSVTEVLEQATLMAGSGSEGRNLEHLKTAWTLHARQAAA